jgi:uncharacterized protein involved in exopolysaccharide biosynthesis
MSVESSRESMEEMNPKSAEAAASEEQGLKDSRAWQAEHLRLLWDRRNLFFRAFLLGLVASTLVAFLIPKSYTSTTQLMPPDSQSTSGMAMMAALAGKAGGGLESLAGDLLGMKTSGSLFIGILRSETAQDRIIQQFDLKNVYGKSLEIDARTKLDENTGISEDKKSGIITINVTDHDPQRATALAAAYVDQLNSLVAELSTSAAHRERVFLEERLKVVKQDLDDASNQLAQFSSKNNTLDIQQEGKAMLDAAANLAGQLIAAQSELEGLRQFYTDNNPRVQSLNARVTELRKELSKLSGVNSNGTPNDPFAGAKGSSGDMPLPSIRNLPLLGVKYMDYYRRAKIQETVFELLTEQYEMAKVQEAKETPSVKVLDPATVPEKKTYPPRLLIMFLGTCLALCLCAFWILGVKYWQAGDPDDPRRVLGREIVAKLKSRTETASGNGKNDMSGAKSLGPNG